MDQLVIFDCDGTLVKSEQLYNSITSELLSELGYPEYTLDVCLDLFAGQSWSTIRTIIEDKHKKKLPDDLIERYIRISSQRMNGDFEACEHADTLLGRLHKVSKLCVASNGERNNVIQSLSVTNLKRYFDDQHIFTKIQVERPKPAPDLFIYACAQMGHVPERSVIIEDSPVGVLAAKAAGIKVLGYVGAAHHKGRQADRLREAGADVIVECLSDVDGHL